MDGERVSKPLIHVVVICKLHEYLKVLRYMSNQYASGDLLIFCLIYYI